jgi:hemolysin III
MHLLWFEAALVLGTLLIRNAHGARHIVAAVIYSACVAGLFGASALYHRGNWNVAWNARLQRFDHAMIFLVIAGTATPVYLLAVPGTLGIVGLVVMWSATASALLLHMLWMDAPERLVGAAFLVLGAIGSIAIPLVWIHAGVPAAVLLISGSLLYAVGAISYHRRSPDPSPTVFGYHEIFHTYVCVAAACQYVAIGALII